MDGISIQPNKASSEKGWIRRAKEESHGLKELYWLPQSILWGDRVGWFRLSVVINLVVRPSFHIKLDLSADWVCGNQEHHAYDNEDQRVRKHQGQFSGNGSFCRWLFCLCWLGCLRFDGQPILPFAVSDFWRLLQPAETPRCNHQLLCKFILRRLVLPGLCQTDTFWHRFGRHQQASLIYWSLPVLL